MEDADRYRCRHIYLKYSDDPTFQAEAACEALVNLDGILLAAATSESCVHVIYSLDSLTFEIVVELLAELEFEMDSSFLISLRKTIYGYLEDNARDHMQIDMTELQSGENEDTEVPQQDNEKYWDDYR